MVKHTLKILRCEYRKKHRKIFKGCLAIFFNIMHEKVNPFHTSVPTYFTVPNYSTALQNTERK